MNARLQFTIPTLLLCVLLLIYCCDAEPSAVQTPVTRVHLIFSNHLDIGFHSNVEGVPGTDAAVLSRYFKDYFPAAINTSKYLRAQNNGQHYRYMTHSYLASLYLDCPEQLGIYCPSDSEIEAFKAAVKRGDIYWHAIPHNLQAEFMDAEFLNWSVQFTHALDRSFGLPHKKVMSQRDVPGLSRAAIPILGQAGVTAISVGVNGGSAVPAVPQYTPFLWRDPTSGHQLLAFWRGGGYSGVPIDPPNECIHLSGFSEIMCTAWRGDNEGPHSIEEVSAMYDSLKVWFPGSTEFVASTLDDFVSAVEEALQQGVVHVDALQVVEGEIGDTWIYGVQSDPVKTAEFRALQRLRRANPEVYDDPQFIAFSRMLLKVPEHTWGVDTKQYPGDYERWGNTALQRAIEEDEKFIAAVDSWKRQRKYIDWAVEELRGSHLENAVRDTLDEMRHGRQLTVLHGEASSAFEQLWPLPLFELLKYSTKTIFSKLLGVKGGYGLDLEKRLSFSSHSWEIRIDPATGAISRLASRTRGREQIENSESNCMKGRESCPTALHSVPGDDGQMYEWASPENLLAKLTYSTYSEADYDVIWNEYAHKLPLMDWFYKDFGKPNVSNPKFGGAKRRDTTPTIKAVWQSKPLEEDSDGKSFHIIVELEFPRDLVVNAGAPSPIQLHITSPADSTDLFIDVVWENKTATRLPEALWLAWQPSLHHTDPESWIMSKLGQPISPLDVIRNGSMAMHGVDDEGITISNNHHDRALLSIRSLDAALVSPGEPTPFPSVRHLPDMSKGMSFCLLNNIWGTNYVMWWPYDGSSGAMRYRFVLQVEQRAAGAVVMDDM